MHQLFALAAQYGYAAVFVLLFVESLGIPVPGEGMLIVAALFAARRHELDIAWVVPIGACAAFLGTSIGYVLGRAAGLPLLHRYGRYVGLSPARQRLGQYLFMRYGGQIIFIGRFISFLRAFEGLLAGLNSMEWRRFLIFNAVSAVIWTSTIGLGAFFFGRTFVHVSRPVGIVLLVATGVALVAGFLYLRRTESVLQREADAALLGSQS